MKKSVIALAAATMLSGAFVADASAASYKVERGDTLWKIAREHHTTVDKLKEMNHLSSDLIFPNQVLTTSDIPEYYTVQKGDTLSKIAKAYGMSVQTLKSINQLNSDLIFPGDRIVLNGSKAVQQTVENKSVQQPVQSQAAQQPVQNQQANQTGQTETKATTAAVQQQNTTAQPSQPVQQSEQPAQNAQQPVQKSQQPAQQVQSQPAQQSNTQPDNAAQGETFTMTATAYTANCGGCSGVTATGMNLKANPNAKVIAVDPSVIPLGTKVYVEGYGEAIAGDTGGSINGNRIDVFVPNEQQARNWGVRTVTVKVLK
ncbi:LysM peptidoglycan-binding domain-containing protein [Bacillus smithii]|uniref:LysM peptidoglycan-binding domain-containing protein n=1 Tax=Bacillus smithii TaxID=1479 RepID=UPI002E1D0FCF|nr:LysM peptidoglycan-binding domain-containing protein [Bacillus smithii]MED1454866.1 LysM peptidoglycan-binding domain-containing protein [Bacillus smithii]